MRSKRNGPAGEGEAGVLIGVEHRPHSKTASDQQADRIVIKAPGAHLLGSEGGPRIVVERNGVASVWIANAPWGWGTQERVFLNPSAPGVDRYAMKLHLRILQAAARECERRERQKIAGQHERGDER